MKNQLKSLGLLLVLLLCTVSKAQNKVHPDAQFSKAEIFNTKANGFMGIWYMNQPSRDKYVYKYSEGMATNSAKHQPIAIYSQKVNKTFFAFGGTNESNSSMFLNGLCFDHFPGNVAKPASAFDKQPTDNHDNPVISMDDKGYIYIFSTAHGTGCPSYISKSTEPYNLSNFRILNPTELVDGKEVPVKNFSYWSLTPFQIKEDWEPA